MLWTFPVLPLVHPMHPDPDAAHVWRLRLAAEEAQRHPVGRHHVHWQPARWDTFKTVPLPSVRGYIYKMSCKRPNGFRMCSFKSIIAPGCIDQVSPILISFPSVLMPNNRRIVEMLGGSRVRTVDLLDMSQLCRPISHPHSSNRT